MMMMRRIAIMIFITNESLLSLLLPSLPLILTTFSVVEFLCLVSEVQSSILGNAILKAQKVTQF